MKILSPSLKLAYLKCRIPTTKTQVAQWEKENPPETWAELPKSLQDPFKILERGEVRIRSRLLSQSPERSKGEKQ